jgi:hypothetical protein
MNAKSVQGGWGRGTDAKPLKLKRLSAARGLYTALKRGVNERSAGSHMFTFVRLCADMCGYVRIIGKKVWGPPKGGTPSGGGRGCTKVTKVPEVTARFFRVEVPRRESTVHKIGFPKPAADGFPLYQCAVAQSGPNVIFSGVWGVDDSNTYFTGIASCEEWPGLVRPSPTASDRVMPKVRVGLTKSDQVKPETRRSRAAKMQIDRGGGGC